MKFHSEEIFCLQRGTKIMRTECLKCSWFAAGSEKAVAVAQRAHKCPMALELRKAAKPALK